MKERIKNILIALGMLVITVALFTLVGNMDKGFIKNCTEAGNSLTYCQNAIDGQ